MKLQTRCWKVTGEKPEQEIIKRAAEIIQKGGLVAFPTETVYGLGATALDGRVVRRVFQAKGRPVDNPLTLNVADPRTAFEYVQKIPEKARALIEAFWPGPLTLILPYRGGLPVEVTGGRPGLGLRMPDHPVALSVIKESGLPLVAPSANLSGRPSPTVAEHVLEDLAGRIDAVLDGGPTGLGLESTVLDLTGEQPVILRPGALTSEDLAPLIGPIETGSEGQAPSGKYAHYTPRAAVILVEGSEQAVLAKLAELAREYQCRGQKVGLLVYSEDAALLSGFTIAIAGSRKTPSTVAAGLFSALRQLDRLGVDTILCAGFSGGGLGAAIQNRLRLASGGRIITVR